MAEFELRSNAVGSDFYQSGVGGKSRVVGVENQKNRVARYQFITPAEGSSHQEILYYSSGLRGGNHIPIRFYIGTDPNSHANAWNNSEYHGTLTLGSDKETFTGSSNVLLLPNTTYYIWFFPGSTTYGYYAWRSDKKSTLTTSGGAGLVYIGSEPYQCYIGNGTSWDLALPYVGNGTGWDLCS